MDIDKGKQFKMSQHFIIKQTLIGMGIKMRMTEAQTNLVAKLFLHQDLEGELSKVSWNYQSMIEMMNYLQQSSGLEIVMAVHQCAPYSMIPSSVTNKQ